MAIELTQELTLPSKGVFNPEIPEGKVTQRCMMVSDQKYLSGTNQSAGSSIHQIVQRTITSPEHFDVSLLTPADTLYLLFKLRILSYGKDYTFRSKCPECGKKIDVNVDLSELPVATLDDDYAEGLVVTLPHTGDTVYTKILTNQDMDEVNRELKRRKKKNPDDESEYILRIVRSIEKVELVKPNKDGKKELTSAFEIERYIEKLTDYDATSILSARNSVEFGIISEFDYICPECGEDIDIGVMFSGEFFRPTIKR